ncbi:MFS transporter [Polycladidibacter hongkongensis]|uniref:MFS transporter n=1 Tax=Polycladidibacter hongkongensis TaxID=1647556 RepID=UPI00082FD00F|nr:MFS transporter [Pseudovibrio hongkongensis]
MTASLIVDDRLAKRNTVLLAFFQAISGSGTTVLYSSVALLVSGTMSVDKSLSTLPVSLLVVGTALGALPAGMLMRRYGRRNAFMFAGIMKACCSLLLAYAALVSDFLLLCLGVTGIGLLVAVSLQTRFAAAEGASEAFRPKAISYVMLGGVIAAILGPQTIIYTKDWFSPFVFVGAYLAQAAYYLLGALVISFLRLPQVKQEEAQVKEKGRSLGQIVQRGDYLIALACAALSYSLMTLLMTSAPLAMVSCGFSESDAALGIQWHVLGMFVPSFFTGSLISRFGTTRVIAAGFVLTGLAGVAGLTGIELTNFWGGLVLLGVGWNFSFIGSTHLLTSTYSETEKSTAQSFNDFIVFSCVGLTSFSSGKLFFTAGWETINLIVLPVVFTLLVLLVFLGVKRMTLSKKEG